jgi:ribosomal-protein-alanine N-acetyltransferase
MTPYLTDIAMRPMTLEDLEQVVDIEQTSFPRPWTKDHFRDELDSPNTFPLVAVASDGRVAGYLCPSQVLDEGEILDVAVRDDFRGQGIGRLLVTEALRLFREQGAQRVWLEVRTSNQAAISLYRALGFRQTGLRERYYENGEDALLMDIFIGSEV